MDKEQEAEGEERRERQPS